MYISQANTSTMLTSYAGFVYILTVLINRRKPHDVLKRRILLSSV